MENKKKIKPGIYEKGKISIFDIITSIKLNSEISKAGAIFTFSGIVRITSNSGKEVKGIQIDAYPELANESINKICNAIKKREGIIDTIIVHLQGAFNISEDLVHVVVASSHREEGFKALKDTVERYKKEIEVWKKELYIDESSEWIH